MTTDMRVSVTRDDMKDEVCVYCSPLATKGTRRSLSAVTPRAEDYIPCLTHIYSLLFIFVQLALYGWTTLTNVLSHWTISDQC